ncbi:LOW QUALITY PROTEIN: UDP-glucose iridoid glucosyltransferase-like [Primulina eburnea]|uniref:LOW QUALITY PROTEIN: UDP-glucose iridoid glucosyltransferase-like n=1 Tax=Primulina eburnea TaxID=1245227 RepID=UPI003C6C7A55
MNPRFQGHFYTHKTDQKFHRIQETQMGSLQEQRLKKVVLVPFPFQGHITPMLQLGSLLHSKGFSVVVSHTQFNAPDIADHPDFVLLPLPDTVGGLDMSFDNMLNVMSAMNTNCEAPFRDHMVHMLQKEEVGCVIHDSIMKFADEVANDLRIPSIVLGTSNASYSDSLCVMLELLDKKLLPLPESQLQESVPNAHPLRYKDLALSATSEIPDIVIDFTRSYIDKKTASAFIWNTVDLLEHQSLQKLQHHYNVPFFTVGPLHKMAPPSRTSLIKEETACLAWLDKQAPRSVIYVSLGSLATIEQEELIDMAWGLANSEQPFLWVIRPSLVNGSEWIKCLPEDFEEKTRERGCIVQWAPQKEVLSHPGIGGFLTHCGWNSTLESICEGVPMICRPCFADQLVDSRYLTHVWRVGLELEKNSGRLGIENAVRTILTSKEGEEMKVRASRMKQEMERCVLRGGSSYNSLCELVEYISTLPRKI